jgi:PAS domain S-box-containing protein
MKMRMPIRASSFFSGAVMARRASVGMQNRADPESTEALIAKTVMQERVKIFMERCRSGAFVSALGVIALALVQSSQVGYTRTGAWVVIMLLALSLMALVAWCYRQSPTRDTYATTWANGQILCLLLVGMAWGSSAWLLWREGLPMGQVINISILVAVMALTLTVISVFLLATLFFSLGVMLPVLMHLLLTEEAGALQVCIGILVFLGVMLQYGYLAESQLFDALDSSTRNLSLGLSLQDSEQRFRMAMDASTDALWDWNLVDGSAYFSPAYYRMIGHVPNDFPMAFESWEARVHPDDRGRVVGIKRNCIENRSSHFDVEYRMRTAQGDWKWIRGRGRAYSRDVDGRALRMVGTHQDITLHKENEMALQAAKTEAEAANNAKSRFLAAASHDLRQPLTALTLYMEVLRSQNTVPGEKLLANISNCITSLSLLLADLLDISKLQAEVVQPHAIDFCVNEWMTPLVAVHAPQAREKGLQLRWRPCHLLARTDPVLMARMVGNLIANAIRYTDHGGVLVACRKRQGKAWVEVWDSGIGIAQDKTQEIFEEYRQVDPGRPSGGGGSVGSGLGLAIVAKTATLMGLQVQVRSRLGHGSVFALELPLSTSLQLTAQPSPAEHCLRIALVDDNESILDAMSAALKAHGHEVVAACNGYELLELLAGDAPDVVVSDFRLQGGETGFDVIASARKVFGSRLAAVIITGDSDPEIFPMMTEHGIAVLQKPLQMDALLAALER